MAAPKFRLSRTSSVRVDPRSEQAVARSLLLIALLHLYTPNGADFIRLYRRWRNRASVFFDHCLSGETQPVSNRSQELLNTLLGSRTVAHLYLPGWGDARPHYYASLIRGGDGLWRLRHRRLRPVPAGPARDGVLITWGSVTPSPDVACAREPFLTRVLTGGISCGDLTTEADQSFECRRQLTHAVTVCQLFGYLGDRLTVRQERGKVVLGVNTDAGDGITHPYDFNGLSVQPYATPRDRKARVTVWGDASDADLLALQTPRCILPSVKGATEYHGDPNDRRKYVVLSLLLLSRLVPVVGVLRTGGQVDLYGLHHEYETGRTVIAEYATGLTLRACKGLPMVKPDHNVGQGLWKANAALLSILRDSAYDETPDRDARVERWRSLRRLLRCVGADHPKDYPDYFAAQGLPLPAGAEVHLARLMSDEQNYFGV